MLNELTSCQRIFWYCSYTHLLLMSFFRLWVCCCALATNFVKFFFVKRVNKLIRTSKAMDDATYKCKNGKEARASIYNFWWFHCQLAQFHSIEQLFCGCVNNRMILWNEHVCVCVCVMCITITGVLISWICLRVIWCELWEKFVWSSSFQQKDASVHDVYLTFWCCVCVCVVLESICFMNLVIFLALKRRTCGIVYIDM